MDGNGNYIIYSPATNGVTSGNLKLRAGGNFSVSTNDQAATSPALTIDTSQRVGIGTTSLVDALSVRAGTDANFHVRPLSGLGLGTGVFIDSLIDGAAAVTALGFRANQYLFRSSSGEFARIDTSGRVGIGTSAPQAKLHVAAGANVALQLDADTGLNTNIALSENGSIKWYFGNIGADDSFRFYDNTAATERLRIDSSGRLLVGTSSDSGGALFQVNGDRIRVGTAKTPASASATGTAGEIAWDANYIYVCTATNTWKRSAIATW
jgi:hypothetical protein